MQIPLAHLDTAVIEEVPIDLWRRVFEAVGWPASLAVKKDSFSHDDVLTAFETDDPTDGLLQAIEALHGLGTESGREAIVTAMTDRRVRPETFPPDIGDRELAVLLFLEQRENAVLSEVFARAQAQIQDGAEHRRYNEFMGREAKALSRLKARGEKLLDAVKVYCRDNDLGDHVSVRAFEDNGVYVFHIVRSHHTKKPLAVLPGHRARATIQYRPVHGDILRYDADVGRLRIAARAASVIDFYRRALGEALFDDPAFFFSGAPVCSLQVLQERGRAALSDHEVVGIGRVRMTECLWERGDRELHELRAPDCFRQIEDLGLPIAEGDLLRAKLKVEVIGSSTRPVTVNIRVPSRIEVSKRRHEDLIDEFLAAIGIRNPQPTGAPLDLWTLHPWRHPAPTWRAVFGGYTDGLVRAGVLSPIALTAVAAAGQASAGRVLEAERLEDGQFYGISREPTIPSRSLSATELDGLELRPEALRTHIRALLGLNGPSVTWSGDDHLDLGVLRVGTVDLRLAYALREPGAGIGDRLRARAAGAHAVLLIPTARDSNAHGIRVCLGEALPSPGAVIRGAIAACSLEAAVPAILMAPDRARLVIDTRSGEVWFDRVPVPRLQAGTHPHTLVEVLARAGGKAVSKQKLNEILSPGREDGDTAARQAKNTAKRMIVEALATVGRELDGDPFPSGPPAGHYRCAVVPHVV
jgi:hypothetical protein